MIEANRKILERAFNKLHYLKSRNIVETEVLINLSLKYFSLEEEARKYEFKRTLKKEIKDFIQEIDLCPRSQNT